MIDSPRPLAVQPSGMNRPDKMPTRSSLKSIPSCFLGASIQIKKHIFELSLILEESGHITGYSGGSRKVDVGSAGMLTKRSQNMGRFTSKSHMRTVRPNESQQLLSKMNIHIEHSNDG